MKRVFIICVLVTLLTGCGDVQGPPLKQENPTPEDTALKEEFPIEEVSPQPITKPLSTPLVAIHAGSENLIDVNLTNDTKDSVYCEYITDMSGISFVALRVSLSNGSELSTMYPGKIASYDLSSGYLVDENYQCIILQIHFPSNYGATDIHVLKVEQDSMTGDFYLHEILTIIDGYGRFSTPPEAMLYQDSVFRIENPHCEGEYLPSIMGGGDIVKLPNTALEGLRINLSQNKIMYATISWNGVEWVSEIFEEEGL